jgi:hypothetical protein
MASCVIQAGSNASESPLRQGTVSFTIGAGAPTSIAVPDTSITANSVVVIMGVGAVNASATSFIVDVVSAGVGFTIVANAAATVGAKTVAYAVLKY